MANNFNIGVDAGGLGGIFQGMILERQRKQERERAALADAFNMFGLNYMLENPDLRRRVESYYGMKWPTHTELPSRDVTTDTGGAYSLDLPAVERSVIPTLEQRYPKEIMELQTSAQTATNAKLLDAALRMREKELYPTETEVKAKALGGMTPEQRSIQMFGTEQQKNIAQLPTTKQGEARERAMGISTGQTALESARTGQAEQAALKSQAEIEKMAREKAQGLQTSFDALMKRNLDQTEKLGLDSGHFKEGAYAEISQMPGITPEEAVKYAKIVSAIPSGLTPIQTRQKLQEMVESRQRVAASQLGMEETGARIKQIKGETGLIPTRQAEIEADTKLKTALYESVQRMPREDIAILSAALSPKANKEVRAVAAQRLADALRARGEVDEAARLEKLAQDKKFIDYINDALSFFGLGGTTKQPAAKQAPKVVAPPTVKPPATTQPVDQQKAMQELRGRYRMGGSRK